MDSLNEDSTNSVMNAGAANGMPNDGTGKCTNTQSICSALTPSGVIQLDPWLGPFKEPLKQRYSKAQEWIKTIDETEGGLEKFSRVRQAIGLNGQD